MSAPPRSAGRDEGERLLLVGSSGGHLAQLVALRPWWRDLERAWCVFEGPDSREHLRNELDVTWAYQPTTRNVLNLIRNGRLAWRLVKRFKPTVVVSTGAGVAVPFFVLARLRGIRTVYIEVYDRVDSATLTGRLCRPFTDLMCVQWEEQKPLYRDVHVIGPLL